MSQTVVVLSPHAFEARAAAGVGKSMRREPWGAWMLYRGRMWDHAYAVIRTGPGKAATAAAAQAAIQYLDPALVMSFGVAGCSDPTVEVGTLVAAELVVDAALAELSDLPARVEDRWRPDPGLLDALRGIPGTRSHPVVCWEGHVVSPVHRPRAHPPVEGPVVADWECAAVASVCATWQVPWGALKVVSDHGEPDRLKRVAVVARRPLEWAAEVLRRACNAWMTGHGSRSDGRVPA